MLLLTGVNRKNKIRLVRNLCFSNSIRANKGVVHFLREIRRELNALKVTQRYMVRGLEHEFLFDQEYVEDMACTDEVDRAIIEELHHAGPYGILPRNVDTLPSNA